MTLKRPIVKEEKEQTREEFIRGGGLVASDIIQENKDEWTKISLRIKSEAISKIDQIVENKMGLTRTGWILQAIEEKFQKETPQRENQN